MAEALCPFCRRQPVDPAWRPFCSERCKLQDLSRWLDGGYKVAGEQQVAGDEGDGDQDQSENLKGKR